MINNDLFHFRIKMYGLFLVYISVGLSFLYLLGYQLRNFWLKNDQVSSLSPFTDLLLQIDVSFICVIFIVGNYLIMSSKEKIEDEMVSEMRGKIGFQMFRALLYGVCLMLYVAIFTKLNENLRLVLFVIAFSSATYVFRLYSSLKFINSNAAPFSILPDWINFAVIPISFIALVLWIISNDMESLKAYLTIPAFFFLVNITYAYVKLSSYIFQKAA